MDRRLVGALLVAVVLLAAISVPAWDGLRISGRGVAIELPADPKVGDCIFDASAGLATAVLLQVQSSESSVREIGESVAGTQVVAGPCNGQPAIGEVVAMVPLDGREPAGPMQGQDGNQECRAAALQYTGLEQVGDRFSLPDPAVNDPVAWNLSIHLRVSWLLPSTLLRSAGRTWSACVASPPGPTRQHGTMAAAYLGGQLPDEFGTCWDSRDVTAAMHAVNCGDSHVAELISMGRVDDRSATTPATIRSSCAGMAARVMGRADPTAGGQLAVRVSPDGTDPLRTTPAMDIVCYVVPLHHSLTGTLVGLRDRPIPFAT